MIRPYQGAWPRLGDGVFVDGREVELGGEGEGLFVQAGTADDERAGVGGPCEGDGFFQALCDLATGERCAGLPGDDDVAASRQGAADRVVSPAAHDDSMAVGGLLEVFEVFGDVPGKSTVLADHGVARHRHNQSERGQARPSVRHTATGALMRG